MENNSVSMLFNEVKFCISVNTFFTGLKEGPMSEWTPKQGGASKPDHLAAMNFQDKQWII